MDDAERRVAVLDRIDENTYRANVVNRVDATRLPPHLVPDAVDVFRAAGHIGLYAGVGQFLPQNGDDVVDEALPVQAALVQILRDLLVLVRLECAKAQILEFPLQLPHTQPVCERRKDVEDLLRRLAAQGLVGIHQIAQRLRALGKLD